MDNYSAQLHRIEEYLNELCTLQEYKQYLLKEIELWPPFK